jgi:hypothetical protein
MGIKLANADSVEQHLMGDDAQTIQKGLRRIREVIRKYGITLLMVAQERAVLDPVEIMRHKKTKMAGSFYLQHFAEYFVYVAPNEAAEGKTDIFEKKLEDEYLKDVMGNNDAVALKIKARMQDSTVGIAKRVGEFTFHKYQGLVNTFEEVFRLAVARNIFHRPNNRTYILTNWPVAGEQAEWIGKKECLINIRDNSDLQNELVKRVRGLDIALFKEGKDDMVVDASSEIDKEGND